MKLRTKFQDEDFDLGEVVNVDIATMPDGRIKLQGKAKAGGLHTIFYDSLDKLYYNWEDYEEPKEGYVFNLINHKIIHIYEQGRLRVYTDEDISHLKEVGMWFETKEEAEKAVEKLKAWKRLKEKGFRFRGLGVDYYERDDIKYDMGELPKSYDCQEMKDLKLLFGGEE